MSEDNTSQATEKKNCANAQFESLLYSSDETLLAVQTNLPSKETKIERG